MISQTIHLTSGSGVSALVSSQLLFISGWVCFVIGLVCFLCLLYSSQGDRELERKKLQKEKMLFLLMATLGLVLMVLGIVFWL